MSLAVQRRLRSDAPIGRNLSESFGKGLNIHQVIHAVNQPRVHHEPRVAKQNVLLSSSGGLTRDIVADPNQNKRNFIGSVSAFDRRAMRSGGRINDVFRTEGK
tara:strand:+ start:1499 stop:1807 length:309 start_codon:yes stop_codon:yes gene_type:complete